MGVDTFEGPPPALLHFVVVRMQFEVSDCCEYIHKFALNFGLEHVGLEMDGVEVREAELLGRLSEKGFQDPLAIADVAADCGVPAAREQFLCLCVALYEGA